jgi:hypothetical protein
MFRDSVLAARRVVVYEPPSMRVLYIMRAGVCSSEWFGGLWEAPGERSSSAGGGAGAGARAWLLLVSATARN